MGGMPLTACSNVDAYKTDAIVRAAIKLDALRSGAVGEIPAGPLTGLFVQTALAAGAAGGLLLLIGIGLVLSGFPSGGFIGVICLLAALGLFGYTSVLCMQSSTPDSPSHALELFYRALGRGKPKEAAKLVVSGDFDFFPRFQPKIQYLKTGANPRPFRGANQFDSYWNEMLRSAPMPYCSTSISQVREIRLAPDLVVVECDVCFVMNTLLYYLLVLLGGISLLIAIIADFVTRTTVIVPVRKLMFRVRGEWHLFNGELQGYEEEDLTWLTGPATPDTPSPPVAQDSKVVAREHAPWEVKQGQAQPVPASKAPWE